MVTPMIDLQEVRNRGRKEVKKHWLELFGNFKWWVLNPTEKENYATFWALGYIRALEEKSAQDCNEGKTS